MRGENTQERKFASTLDRTDNHQDMVTTEALLYSLIYLGWQMSYCRGVAFLNLTLSRKTNVNFFQMREFADDNFKFDDNSRKFSKLIENTVEKGENAHHENIKLQTKHPNVIV